jgi:actin-related protein 6
MRGFVKPDDEGADETEQILGMETERFSVPELLFNPSDIEIDQAGVAEATWQSLQGLDQVRITKPSLIYTYIDEYIYT